MGLVFGLAGVTSLLVGAPDAKAATVNNPVCTSFSYNPAQLGSPGSVYLDVGQTTYVQFYGSDTGPSGTKVRISFTDTGGPGTSVVGLPPTYTSLPGQTTLLKNFPFTGTTAGTARNIQVDFQVLDVGDVPTCWNRINYQVTVTALPAADFTLDISPLTSNVVQSNKISYSVYANCNRGFNGTNTISGLTFAPGGLTNVSGAFSVANLSCGGYSYLTITTSKTSGPASTPGAPNPQTFSVSGTAAAYGITRSSNAQLVIYGLPVVTLTANPSAVAVNGSSNLTWTSTYTDNTVNGGFPCTLYQDGSLLGNRIANGGPESKGPFAAARVYRFDILCTGYGGFQGIGTAYVNVTASPSNVFVEWTLNGVPQTDSLASTYPGASYQIRHQQTSGANCTTTPLNRVWCNDGGLQADAPYNVSLAEGWKYQVYFTQVPSGLTFTGITPPGEQNQQVAVPYPTTNIGQNILSGSGTKVTFTLNFIDFYACPDYNVPPYNTSNYYIGVASSTALPPASIKNVTIGDAGQLSPNAQFSGGTFTDAFGSGVSGTYSIVNGNLLVPTIYGNGTNSSIAGSTGDWVFVESTTGKHAYGCGLRDTQFRINDFNHTVSTTSQTVTQGQTASYSMSQLSKGQFNQPIKFLLTSSNLPAATYVTYCDGSNSCSSTKTLTPAIGGTVNGFVKIGTDTSTPAGTYTFVTTARYAGNYSNNDKNSVSLTLIVNAATPAPTVTITAPANGSSVVTGSNVPVSWTSTNANVNGCTVTTSVAGHGPWNSQPTAGSITDNNVTANTTYTVTCAGPSGSGNSTSSITVTAAGAPTGSFITPVNNDTAPYFTQINVQWTSTNSTYCWIYNNIGSINNNWAAPTGSTTDFVTSAQVQYNIQCRNALGVTHPVVTVNVYATSPPLTAGSLKTYNTNTDPAGNPVPCGQIKLTWTAPTGNGTPPDGYYIYTSPSGASVHTVPGGGTLSTFYTTSATNTYYIASYKNFGAGTQTSARIVASPPPTSQPIAPVPAPCLPVMTSSDIDVTTIDGATVNIPSPCSGTPDSINGNKDYFVGSVIRYKVNICNTGPVVAPNPKVTLVLSNVAQPPSGWNFQVSCGGCSNQSTPTPTGAGTAASPFVWDFGANSVPATNGSWSVSFDAATKQASGSNQTDYYAYVYGDIKLNNVTYKSLNSNFVHFRLGSQPDIHETAY
mgnify:CR=1 FL=1